jgi:hypothetical protein
MYYLSPNTLDVAGFSLGEHVMAKRIRSGVGGQNAMNSVLA